MRLVVDLQGFQSVGSRMRGIGRYSLSLALAMARAPRGHDLVIALNDAIPDIIESGRALFEPLIPRENIVVWSSLDGSDALMPERSWRRSVGGLLFEDAMSRLRPDIVHISSLFEGWAGDVVSSIGQMPVDYSTAVTLYDLIPMQSPDTYLADPRLRKWYEDRVAHLRRADVFLAISDYSRKEGIELLGVEPERVVNISGSCSEMFHPVIPDPLQRLVFNAKYGISRPYLLYTGGFDSRKNVPALIRAFADLPEVQRASHQLVIAGYAPPHEAAQLEELREQCGLRPDECVLTGYVPDDDLLVLYSNCRLYVFPSLREGFGLPILEAMSCGAVVIGANRTSLPEVIGLEEAMFDPEDRAGMRDRILQGLTDEEFRERLRKHALRQASRFSWNECAARAWDGFEEECERRRTKRTFPVMQPGSRRVLTILPEGKERDYVLSGVPHSDFATASSGDGDTAFTAARLAPYAVILVLVDDVNSLRAAIGLLEQRACWVHVCGVRLEDLCLHAIADPTMSGWIQNFLVMNGQYRLLGNEVPRERLAEFLSHWVVESAAGVRHHSVRPSAAAWQEETGRVQEGPLECTQHALALQVGELEPAPPIDDAGWLHLAQSYTWNRCLGGSGRRRLLVDITELAKGDAGTGIQRVVRNIVRELLRSDSAGFEICPVYIDGAGAFHHAHKCALALLGIGVSDAPADAVVDWRPDDIFLGLDLSADAARLHPHVFQGMKHRGIAMYFVVYDLIPLLRSDCVDEGAVPVFHNWYHTIADIADGLVCISRAVADEMVNWLDQVKPARERALSIGYFHLGADLDGASAPAEPDALATELRERTFGLMVGTIEPRKGYAQALSAFESLWDAGEDVALVIVGKQGWMVEALATRIRTHPRLGHQLFWYERASDAALQALYAHARFLLCASEAEGFGLPLIEGAQHGLPILARDIPVFHEVAGDCAHYFSGPDASSMATAVRAMLQEDPSLARQRVSLMPRISWGESAEQLLSALRDERWYMRHVESKRHWFYIADSRLGTEVGERIGGVIHSSGRSGFLVYGPYAAVGKGRYRLRLHGRFLAGAGSLELDVASERGALMLLREEMTISSPSAVSVYETRLVLAQDVSDLEIRIKVAGPRHVVLSALELLPEDGSGSGITHPLLEISAD